jgi:hypothetical protein
MSLVGGEQELPEGLGFRLALDMQAMTNYVNMPEDKKKQMVEYIRSSTTGDEARNRVSEVISNLHGGGSFR